LEQGTLEKAPWFQSRYQPGILQAVFSPNTFSSEIILNLDQE
ncbi:hypothetical protein scyTo_0016428, partial [Scyliorhinus torazame]|nr:hypothetical protein [Scyliorhinus torazame]